MYSFNEYGKNSYLPIKSFIYQITYVRCDNNNNNNNNTNNNNNNNNNCQKQ